MSGTRLDPTVVVREEGGAAFALKMSTGEVIELNESASVIVRELADGADPSRIVQRLCERYPDADAREVETDVVSIIEALRARGFLLGAGPQA